MAYSSTANPATFANNPELLSDKTPNLKTFVDELQSGAAKYDVVTDTTQQAVAGGHYIANNGSQVVITMPTTAAVGTTVSVVGLGAGGWKFAQNASQIIHKSGSATTTGTGGSVTPGTATTRPPWSASSPTPNGTSSPPTAP
jgi:hypothetical protein